MSKFFRTQKFVICYTYCIFMISKIKLIFLAIGNRLFALNYDRFYMIRKLGVDRGGVRSLYSFIILRLTKFVFIISTLRLLISFARFYFQQFVVRAFGDELFLLSASSTKFITGALISITKAVRIRAVAFAPL